MPKGGGDLPVRCHGTRYITHKCNALQRVINQLGAYIVYLTLAEDQSVKAVDCACLKKYTKMGQDQYANGCAMYINVLKAS